MFPEIAEAPNPQNGDSKDTALEPVPENSKPTGRGHSKSMSASSTTVSNNPTAPDFPIKTDKPRPHQCMTCKRSFARLEHLKRHERSHTKEKPFECPECTRCFARRDLLLRHQQKLHMTTTPSSRPKVGRRESSSSTMSAAGKIRKNSQIHANAANMRPRANTISHTGNPTLGMFANGHMTVDGIQSPQPMMLFGRVLEEMPPAAHPPVIPGHHGAPTGLPKLNTSIANSNISGGLRTAPVFADASFAMDTLFSPDTVNPSALHFPEAPPTAGLDSPSPFQEISGLNHSHMNMGLEGGMDWMNGFGHDLTMMDTNDSNAIAGSSPSVIDSDSPGAGSENILDRKPSLVQHTAHWQTNPFPKGASALPDYMMDMGLGDSFPQGPPSPSVMPDFIDGQFTNPQFQLQNPFGQPLTPHQGIMGHHYPPSFGHPDSPSTLASTTDTSARHSSVSSGHSIAIPEATRHAIMITLAQPGAMFSQRKYSQPTISSPLSPGFASKAQAAVNVPSTGDLQKFVVAYVKYFHPHMPIFHIPTLSFDTPMSSGFQASGRSNSPVFNVANGGGCLILAMSAIGALYEGETEVSKALFNFSKRVLSTYLEERRKADISSAFNSSINNSPQSTPVWLVQAMLLNVVYGHMCGDKTSEINAHNHGAALVSLARAAQLTVPASKLGNNAGEARDESWNPRGEDPSWYEWRVAEEKKRTLYAVFNVSSLLTFAYNHTPALKNGEILLDLPCDEDLWAAESAEAWYALGGSLAAEQNNVPFTLALSNLLSARERQPIPMQQMSQAFCKPQSVEQQQRPDWPRAEFHASTFGCLVLIDALHNYIWETRQRHVGRQWTTMETEDMHRRIEPALVAWQAVWARIHHHSVERPNPYGMGPLAADSIPLLDLAYLTLYVNLGRSKECFWQRDFEEMSREIASGYELIQHADGGEEHGKTSEQAQKQEQRQQSPPSQLDQQEAPPNQTQKASRRERHLRKAAFHAANSMLLAARTATTFADFSSRELPIQQALCHFECAQVLAEWVATLQERVGSYLGILGLDSIDFETVPAIVLLDQEDIILLRQLDEILSTAEVKMARDSSGRFQKGKETFEGAAGVGMDQGQAGYSARILQVTGRMLDSSSVWPVMHLMNHGLGVQARFMKDRAERSRTVGQ